MNYALVKWPACCGVVTADADGQHHPDDIVEVAKALRADRRSLTLGVRSFGGEVPFRSKLGNNLTRSLMRVMVGQKLADTQTGLRGIPAQLIPHLLKMQSSGYEFELDMLLACKYQAIHVTEVPIRTIYLNQNESSHFHPVFDSMRIYFLLLRFSALSLLTAVLDNVVFAVLFGITHSVGRSQIVSRTVAMVFNYLGARRSVFHSQQRHATVLPKYVALVAFNGLISYGLIQFLTANFGMRAVPAKLLAEALLFIANFAIQRDFVFTRREQSERATDWDTYYKNVVPTAKLTRKYTTAKLVDAMKRYAKPAAGNDKLSILEIGGANSCFLDRVLADVGCRSYDVVDTNAYGLSLLNDRARQDARIRLHEESVLDLKMQAQADIVYSVGLVEHFDVARTRQAVLAHFDVLRPGGIAIITFPTPTFLYRIVRGLAEALGIWKFPDERPLKPPEVLATVRERGEVLQVETMWPLILTQTFLVVRKHASALQ
jgi:putative flippase GtrA